MEAVEAIAAQLEPVEGSVSLNTQNQCHCLASSSGTPGEGGSSSPARCPEPTRPVGVNTAGSTVLACLYLLTLTGAGPTMSLDIANQSHRNNCRVRDAHAIAFALDGVRSAKVSKVAHMALQLFLAYINGMLGFYPPVRSDCNPVELGDAEKAWILANKLQLHSCDYHTDKIQEVANQFGQHLGVVPMHATAFFERAADAIGPQALAEDFGRSRSPGGQVLAKACLYLADLLHKPLPTSLPDDFFTFWDASYPEILAFVIMAYAEISNHTVRLWAQAQVIAKDVKKLVAQPERSEVWRQFTAAGSKGKVIPMERMAGGARTTGNLLKIDMPPYDCVMRPPDHAFKLMYLTNESWTIFAIDSVSATDNMDTKGKGKSTGFDTSVLALHSALHVMVPGASIVLQGKRTSEDFGSWPVDLQANVLTDVDVPTTLPCTMLTRLSVTRVAFCTVGDPVKLSLTFATTAQAFVEWCTFPTWHPHIQLSDICAVYTSNLMADYHSLCQTHTFETLVRPRDAIRLYVSQPNPEANQMEWV